MSRKAVTNAGVGRSYGKIDLERVGFFIDCTSSPLDVYDKPVTILQPKSTKRQIIAGPSKELFEKKFVRIFEGEPLTDVSHDEARKSGVQQLPPSPTKKHSTAGDSYGCFDKPIYFSPEVRTEAKSPAVLPNAKIKPNPLGGPGYANICLSPYPSYSHEPYDHFYEKAPHKKTVFLTTCAPSDYFYANPYADEKPGPTYVAPLQIARKTVTFYVPFPKEPGGSHEGCFDKFPEYKSDPYVKTRDKATAKPKFIIGGPPLRSKYTNSIISQLTRVSCNAANYTEYRGRAYLATR